MNKQMSELFNSAPESVKEATMEVAKTYREMIFAEQQRDAWTNKAEVAKLSWDAAYKKQAQLLARWDGINADVEPLKECT